MRPARVDDVDEIARVQLATWRIAYRRMLPRHVLEEIDEAWLGERWLEAVTAPPSPRHRVLIAVEQVAGEQDRGVQEYVVGFAASGPADEAALAPDEDAAQLDPAAAAITDLLVEPRWGRRGHGSRLLSAMVDMWRADGFTTAQAWIFEQDAASKKFLTSAAWAPDNATRALDVDDLLIPQLRLHVAL